MLKLPGKDVYRWRMACFSPDIPGLGDARSRVFFRNRKRGHDTPASGIPIRMVNWRHRVYGHDTIAILWVQHDKMRRVKWRKCIVFSNKIESSSLRIYPYDNWLTIKAYLSAITVTNSPKIFCLQDGGKIMWNKITSLPPYVYGDCLYRGRRCL